jgi:hypothetical protein
METLRAKVKKLKSWLKENQEKIGKSGKPRKSNLTDTGWRFYTMLLEGGKYASTVGPFSRLGGRSTFRPA